MGSYFIDIARKDMKKFFVNLPDVDLAYFPEHTEHFNDYVEAVEWAQDYARWNRDSSIVRGNGNPESFSRCSHGAGRAMSRKSPPQLCIASSLRT
jgi:RNA-splicing ligase RtcB